MNFMMRFDELNVDMRVCAYVWAPHLNQTCPHANSDSQFDETYILKHG
jgi:hypothetical protein